MLIETSLEWMQDKYDILRMDYHFVNYRSEYILTNDLARIIIYTSNKQTFLDVLEKDNQFMQKYYIDNLELFNYYWKLRS
jgi:hypothetical protein